MKSYKKVKPFTVWGSPLFFFYYAEVIPYDIIQGREVKVQAYFGNMFNGYSECMSEFSRYSLQKEIE